MYVCTHICISIIILINQLQIIGVLHKQEYNIMIHTLYTIFIVHP